ncbi:MAG: cnrH 2 [Candidatus Acidoferrum typicum]|nr:cnrH 2 [Candidatus Acidoferrum typicum]
MSVKELQALTRKFADAFDQRDLQPILDMLSEDVEVFDHVPYRFDGKALFAKYLNEVIASLACASFGFRQPSCRMYSDEVGIVNAHDMFYGSHQRRQDSLDPWPNYLGLHQTKRAVEDCERPLLCNTQGSLRIEPGHMGAWRCTMTINNPLADNSPDHEDQSLVLRARSGDHQALDLVQRHQTWIYNIAIRMLHHPQDAEDTTQEILIKVLTRLSSFEGRSSFRTWLYRILVNHVLNMKRGRVEVQHESIDFAAYGAALDATPDLELADLKVTSAEADLLVTEEMLSCTSGMLLCLDREQRLTFILGAIFEVSDTVGAEVLEITPDNFRQRLARARRDLRNFMNDKCGLVNQANPCRCAKKTRAFIQAGYVDPENLLFVRERIGEVREAAPKVHEALSTLDEKCAEIFRGHPFYKAPDLAPMLRRLVARTHITN